MNHTGNPSTDKFSAVCQNAYDFWKELGDWPSATKSLDSGAALLSAILRVCDKFRELALEKWKEQKEDKESSVGDALEFVGSLCCSANLVQTFVSDLRQKPRAGIHTVEFRVFIFLCPTIFRNRELGFSARNIPEPNEGDFIGDF